MTLDPYSIPGPERSPNYQIVGTAYQGHSVMGLIKDLPRFGDPYIALHTAELVPEPDNPYDGNAVGVRVDGWHLGYLAREDAAEYAPIFHRLLASGYQPQTQCNLRVYRNEAPHYDVPIDAYVRIYLPDPDKLVPLNRCSISEAALLPWGNAAQVRGEDDHLDHLFDYVPPGGNGLVIVTLHAATQQLKNGAEKKIVEVRLDGERIGRMTPAVAAHFLPAINHAADLGKDLAAWARLEGSALAVNITVQASKSNEVADTWLNDPPAPPGPVNAIADRSEVPPAFNTGKQPRQQVRPAASRPASSSGGRTSAPTTESKGAGKTKSSSRTAGGGCCGCLVLVILFIVLIAIFL